MIPRIPILLAAACFPCFAGEPIRVLVWDEQQPEQKQAYGEKFLGETVAAHLESRPGLVVKTANLDGIEQGCDEATLDATDVVVWWGHRRSLEVSDANAERVAARVREGRLGLIALHSAHWAKPFVRLMQDRAKTDALAEVPEAERAAARWEFLNQDPIYKGIQRLSPPTPRLTRVDGAWRLTLPQCVFPDWRADGEPSHVTTLLPDHPIAAGLAPQWDIAQTEMYGEPFHVPPPDAVVFEERWDKGERFRSGCVWKVGKGRVFYFRPGHETYPVYKQAEPLRVIENAVRWLGADAAGPESLREAAGGAFTMGAGVSDHIDEQAGNWPLLVTQFSSITPENCMKVVEMQPREGEFRFDLADRFAAFAKAKELRLCGHCLVWAKDDRTPPWFFRDGDAPAGRELLLRRMKAHIDAVAGRYRGQVVSWDVVNEALDDGAADLRPSGWLGIAGADFIGKAFEYAHAADPGAMLVYNDYNNELPGKREKMIRLLGGLIERGTPVHAVGIQGHYQIDEVPFDDLEITLVALRELNLKVVITELDIDAIPRGRWWADGGAHREEMRAINPYPDGLPVDVAKRQAEQYGRLFRLFRKHADIIERVTFWNLHDGESWLNDFPWKRVNHPLLFDRARQPKPAYSAVIEALDSSRPFNP